MNAAQSLALVATWFVFGMARIAFTFTMVEHRVDHPDWATAIGFTRQAAKDRINAVNYDARGQRLLPWYRVVSTTYWMVVAVAVSVAVYFG